MSRLALLLVFMLVELSVADNSWCSTEDGFFFLSGQCFKYFHDEPETGHVNISKAFCEDNGLTLAHPHDVIGLRSYLLQKYGYAACWLNAQRFDDNTYFTWLDNNAKLGEDSPYWCGNHPTTERDCVILLVKNDWANKCPTQPLHSMKCDSPSNLKFRTLCEKVN
ncbi:unnamed protein product [Meganyctiphanes norvegica]|uniref:C-type lectin domain-containing protein n=1 Tax=Meganyctiphanes norvegica TaxID=48144 RepID=A0AAV2Q4P2_MEGNR